MSLTHYEARRRGHPADTWPASAPTRGCPLLVLWLVLGGCGGALVGNMAEEIPEPLITESLETLQQPDTQQLITDLASSPAIQEATAKLVEQMTNGFLAALTEGDRAEHIEQAVGGFVRDITETVAETLSAKIAPALSQGIAQGLERGLVKLTDEGSLQRVAELSRTLARAAAEELLNGVHAALDDPAVQETLGVTVRNIAYNAAMGVGEAIEELEKGESEPREPASSLTSSDDDESGASWAWWVAAFAAVLLLAVAVLSGYRIRKRERALIAIVDALKSAEGRPWEGDLRSLLSGRFRNDADARYLDELLEKHPELRLRRHSASPPEV